MTDAGKQALEASGFRALATTLRKRLGPAREGALAGAAEAFAFIRELSSAVIRSPALPGGECPRIRQPLLLGVWAIGIFFGIFGMWAAFFPLSSAASAPGQVRTESYRKTVQHLEGGILREILAKEGDLVSEGQALARLDDTQSGATVQLLRGQSDASKALEARLIAERDGQLHIVYPLELGLRRANPRVAETIAGQEKIFASRRQSLQGQIDVLEQRILQLNAEIGAYQAQVNSAEQQIQLVNEELTIVRDLFQRGLEKKPRLLSLEKQLAQLEGTKGQQLGLIARAEQAIGEAKLQMAGLKNTLAKEVTAELREVQMKLGELDDRLRAAIDVRERTEIAAPQSGRVVKLRHFTPGGVLKPGEPLLDIVPQGDRLVIDARISPLDIDAVHAGLDAEVKLSAFKQRSLPIITGKVVSVSADALADERSGQSFYLAQIELSTAELARLKNVQLYPGMPSEVLVITGKRTPLGYFLDPLRDSFRRAFRED